MSVTVTFTTKAYSKIYLHAAKYPSNNIGGYLLGKKTDSNFEVVDILPIHHEIPVGPILEISAQIIEKDTDKSLTIIGYYYGNEYATAIKPVYIEIVKETIERNQGYSIIVEIVDEKLGNKNEIFLKTDSKYALKLSQSIESTNEVIDKLLKKNLHYKFIDFEDHMNSSSVSSLVFRNDHISFDDN